jgi:hypothetical protein
LTRFCLSIQPRFSAKPAPEALPGGIYRVRDPQLAGRVEAACNKRPDLNDPLPSDWQTDLPTRWVRFSEPDPGSLDPHSTCQRPEDSPTPAIFAISPRDQPHVPAQDLIDSTVFFAEKLLELCERNHIATARQSSFLLHGFQRLKLEQHRDHIIDYDA